MDGATQRYCFVSQLPDACSTLDPSHREGADLFGPKPQCVQGPPA